MAWISAVPASIGDAHGCPSASGALLAPWGGPRCPCASSTSCSSRLANLRRGRTLHASCALPSIAPTASSREEVNRAAKILRADLDRFFGDLFACPVLRRHLQNEVEDQWLEEEGCSALTIAWRKIGRLVLRGEVVEPTLWYTTASRIRLDACFSANACPASQLPCA